MNAKSYELMKKFLPNNYVQQAQQAVSIHENEIRILIEKCKIPEKGWPDKRIELLLENISLMDSNNFEGICGMGEREGRIYSELVARRHYNLAHGIGRSGDLTENQPKAAGSSLLNKLTNCLVLDLLKISGLTFAKSAIISPMATGMTLTFCMLSIRQTKPQAKYVIMPRIDQKSCIKSVVAAGFTPIIIENLLVGDELRTDLKTIEAKIVELEPENVACVFSVTSCFAPRASDSVEEIALLCDRYDIFHLINNAYGLQSSKCTHIINQASRNGRVDIVVQSTDKNILVPVGGTIIASFDEKKLEKVSSFYPGRASSSQSLDILITLLSLGTEKYNQLLQERKTCFNELKSQLEKIAEKYCERVLSTPNNTLSLGLSLTNFGSDPKDITKIGGMLFTKFVSGVRCIAPGDTKEVGGITFKNFGSHSNNYPCAYLTVTATIGFVKSDIDVFIKRLTNVLDSLKQPQQQNKSINPNDNNSKREN